MYENQSSPTAYADNLMGKVREVVNSVIAFERHVEVRVAIDDSLAIVRSLPDVSTVRPESPRHRP